jgi:hypothetical protein
MARLNFTIGEITVELSSAFPGQDQVLLENYEVFLTDRRADILLTHMFCAIPSLDGWELCFDNGATWKMYNRPGQHALAVYSNYFGQDPYHLAVFNQDFTEGEIFTNLAYSRQRSRSVPLLYPLMELLFANLLAAGYGLLVHACALKVGDQGLLFAGNSGAGKSTLARLLSRQPGFTLLSDDRVILRRMPDGYRIFGTPWHGDAQTYSAESANLGGVYILKHGTSNQARPLRPVELASLLLARSFPTFWNSAGLSYSVDLLGQLSQVVAGFELGFTPDQGAVEFIAARI